MHVLVHYCVHVTQTDVCNVSDQMTYPAFRTSLLETKFYKVLRSEVPNG